jgi:E3 ubiquitin-protein ligase BRE1
LIELLEYENDEFRKQINCSINKDKKKSVTLMKCGHCFSREAIDDRVANRMRRCPACNLGFTTTEIRDIYLTC